MMASVLASGDASKEAGTLLSAAGGRRRGGLDGRKRGSGLIPDPVVDSELSFVIAPEDQQATFL